MLVNLTSIFNWIYQYSGTFNQNFLLVLFQLENFYVRKLLCASKFDTDKIECSFEMDK